MQVRKIIWKLFELMPTPEAGVHADEATVRELIQPLGLAPEAGAHAHPLLQRLCREGGMQHITTMYLAVCCALMVELP